MKRNTIAADHALTQALEKLSQPVSCGEGFILFHQGEIPRGLYILESGEASLVMESDSGRVVMCAHAGAASLLGLPAIIGNAPYTMTAMVRKGSEVRFVSRNDFEEVMREKPHLCFTLLQVLAAEVRSARQAVAEA